GELKVVTNGDWDAIFNGTVSIEALASASAPSSKIDVATGHGILPPIGNQEVWAAGVTYLRSRTARMEESSDAGGSSFYDRVYNAHRPELFFKATPHRVVGHGQSMRHRLEEQFRPV